MKIKTKISLGLLFLFALFLFISGLGIYNLRIISQNMKGILKANFETIEYSKNMLKLLDNLHQLSDDKQLLPFTTAPLLEEFEKNLKKQEGNITEIGEKELTETVRNNFNALNKALQSQQTEAVNYTISTLNKALYDIIDVNSRPIIRKNQEADSRAQDAIFLMSIVATLCFLLSFSFVFNFPSYIANPIKELTENIKNVADGNYKGRLHFKSKDEFGELATAFNTMAKRLDEYEHSNLARIIYEKQRVETLVDNMNDPLIGLDEHNKILFVNTEGCAVLGLSKDNLIGKYAPDVALKNDLLRTLLADNSTKPLKIISNSKENYFEKDILNMQVEDKAIGKVIVLRNITQFQERDAQNTHFVATVTHVLKAPVLLMSKTLLLLETDPQATLTVEQKQQIAELNKSIQQLILFMGELSNLPKKTDKVG